MILRQMFEPVSCTYTYLVASRQGGEALLIDPVFEKAEQYLQLLGELDLKLLKVIDTHVHADHITAMGALRDQTNCITVMGEQSPVDIVSMRVSDGEYVHLEGVKLQAIHTPGHTSDSYCFLYEKCIFTGDTLLIRGTGRTDFQNGDAGQQYDSIFGKLLTLPEDTIVLPGHDYRGQTASTIGEEKAHNPRLRVRSKQDYIALMDNLNLPNPKMMDVAVPENMKMGLSLERQKEVPSVDLDHTSLATLENYQIVDLREETERQRFGIIPNSLSLPYSSLDRHFSLLKQCSKPILFVCAAGERSAMAVAISRASGLENIQHLVGGFTRYQQKSQI